MSPSRQSSVGQPTWVVDRPDAGARLDRWLAAPGRLGSRGRAVEALERGRVFVDDLERSGADAGLRLEPGQRVRYWADRPGSASTRSRPRRGGGLAIVFEDDALVVLDKPAGVLTVRLPDEQEGSSLEDELRAYWRSHGRRAPLVVHRIDRDTSGLVVFAKAGAAWRALKEQFARREPERVYLALVAGVPHPAQGRWRDWLRWDRAALCQRPVTKGVPHALECATDYAVVEAWGDVALVECRLRTGRQHQIRAQAWLHGHPLIGERRYSGPLPDWAHRAMASSRRTAEDSEAGSACPADSGVSVPRQALHARRLSFVHPVTSRRMTFEAELPRDLASLIAELRRRGRRS